MAAVGNLNDYVKFQMAQGMEKGGGVGGAATEMAVGLAMAQQMIQQGGLASGGSAAAQAPAGGATGGPAALELLAPADVAKILGVPEQDVLSIIESGELSAKKIGASYRVKRSSLNEYLAG
jgi:excisionase family DNA binding protein